MSFFEGHKESLDDESEMLDTIMKEMEGEAEEVEVLLGVAVGGDVGVHCHVLSIQGISI